MSSAHWVWICPIATNCRTPWAAHRSGGENVVPAMPWQGVSLDEVSARIIERAIELVHKTRLLLPGVRQALELCREQG